MPAMPLSPSQLGSALAKLRKGITERPSAKKQAICRVTIRIAQAVANGNPEEANRIREDELPHLVARRALKAQAGL